MKGLRISLAAITALLLLAGCGTIGDVLGTGSPNYPSNTQSISGNVNYIDYNARRIDLNSNNGYTTSVYYNNSTSFTLNNQNVSSNAIRQGDYITVQAYNNSSGQLIAQNVSDNGGGMASGYPAPYPSGNYPNNGQFTVTGTVNFVDTSAQRIDLYSAYTTGLRTNGGQGNYSVYYNSNTPVYYQGNTYSPTALERGDQVSISATDNGGGRYFANSINVTRNIRNQ